MFLLPKENQLCLIKKVAKALKPGDSFLFTAPYQLCRWQDLLTGRGSMSLGREAYQATFQYGLALVATPHSG